MELVAQQDGRRFWLLRQGSPYQTPIPKLGSPYVAVVLACDPLITPDQQACISTQLVETDCRYMLAWGIDATNWDASVDYAFIASDPNLAPADERLLMTTWHDNESISELVWFACNCTNFGIHEFRDYMFIMIGEGTAIESELLTSLRDLMNG